MIFSLFTVLYSHKQSILEHFHHSSKKPSSKIPFAITSISPNYSHPSLAATSLISDCVALRILDISWKELHVIYGLL